jgi:hypothetical protein
MDRNYQHAKFSISACIIPTGLEILHIHVLGFAALMADHHLLHAIIVHVVQFLIGSN